MGESQSVEFYFSVYGQNIQCCDVICINFAHVCSSDFFNLVVKIFQTNVLLGFIPRLELLHVCRVRLIHSGQIPRLVPHVGRGKEQLE